MKGFLPSSRRLKNETVTDVTSLNFEQNPESQFSKILLEQLYIFGTLLFYGKKQNILILYFGHVMSAF